MKWLKVGSAAVLIFAFGACASLDDLTDLEVINENNPDTERALGEAGDIESLVASSFEIMWDAMLDGCNDGGCGSPSMALSAMAEEGSVSWGNYDIKELSSEPRKAYNNSASYRYEDFAEVPWYGAYEALSSVFDGLNGLEDPAVADELGANAVTRVRAFGKFVQGMGHGWLALMFDSAFIFDETVDLEAAELELSGHQDVFTAALGYFNEAISIANSASFTLPSNWINGNALTSSEFVRLIHSQMARWIPQMARNPAQRAAVDWNSVISHVDAGITSDFAVEGDGDVLWWSALHYFTFQNAFDNSWSRADYKLIGQYDTGGGYANWLATPVADRTEFVLNTPDLRIHAAGDGTAAGTDFAHIGPSPFRVARGTYHFSFYTGTRYEDIAGTDVGPIVYILTEEMQLNKAEGLLRLAGAPTQAVVDIINATRVTRGGMTPATTGNTFDELMDMIIYERRIEDYGMCSGCAFFNRRGEGPLSPTGPNHHQGMVEGTPLQFAPPGKELEVLQKPNYTFGGIGNEGASGPAAGGGGSGTTVSAWHVYIPREARRRNEGFNSSAFTSLVRY